MFLLFKNINSCGSRLPPSAQDREQLKMELQQVNQQITQQTRCMEVSLLRSSLLMFQGKNGTIKSHIL